MKAVSASRAALLLAGGMCLLPFLLPYHQQPVLSFYPEWLAVALGVVAALALLLSGSFRAEVALPVPALWLAAFAGFLALQIFREAQAYPQTAALATLYVLYAVLVVQLGAQLVATLGVERVAIVLAGFVLAGALANAIAGVIQFYGRPALFEDVIAELRGPRAYGNIAQPNLYANYLALGQAALLFLWLRVRLRSAYAAAGLVLLVLASALSGSRGALLYAIWSAGLAALAARAMEPPAAGRLKWGAMGVAGALVAAHLFVPWLNSAMQLGLAGQGALERLQLTEPRPAVFLLALRMFLAAPLAGVGMGEFGGAAFVLGLDPSLTAIGEVWTSPHNLPLQLLAETGVIGSVLALGALGVWALSLLRRYRSASSAALWWLVAAAGIELIHSLIEYPLWSAHFLGLAALFVGASCAYRRSAGATAVSARITGVAACVALAVALAFTLRDYLRLDLARAAGTRTTLVPAVQAQRDAGTMQSLRHGLLGPVAELWIFTGLSLDRSRLEQKLAMGERVARRWPANSVIVRQAALLALAGRTESARAMLDEALGAFPHRLPDTIRTLEQALAADQASIAPLLEQAAAARRESRKRG